MEDLKAKLATQEVELQLRNTDTEALIAKIGQQSEKLSQERSVADAEEQRVRRAHTDIPTFMHKITHIMHIRISHNSLSLFFYINKCYRWVNIIIIIVIMIAISGRSNPSRSDQTAAGD